jgi:carbon-monoxide dehydrogenase small subunit/xanthine dehydrogenase small subunit
MTLVGRPPATFTFTVNGEPVALETSGGRRLLDVLRLDLGLTGTKEGCGEGECGACSVLVDGEVVNSCLLPVCQIDGCDVRTVEGLAADDGSLDPLQTAFLEAGAVQCGSCTPGMLMAAGAFLASGAPLASGDRHAEATDASIREAIAGNLCRCTGYTKIVEAIAAAAAAPAVAQTGALLERALRPPSAPRHVTALGEGPTVVRARSLEEALGLVADGWRPLAGGTDLMAGLAAGSIAHATRFVDLTALGGLRGVRREGAELVIGALTTYTDLRRSADVAAGLPVLAEVAASVGARQVQNRGTIGGNVMNASPAGDTLPLLLATDARLVLQGPAGERAVSAADFFTGYRRTASREGELLTEIRIPLIADRQIRFRKVGTRRAQAISKVVLAVSWRHPDGRAAWSEVRVAFGSVAEVPIRAGRAEAVLEGATPSREVAERAAEAAEADVRPINDVRSTAGYRRAVSGRILRRIILAEAGS